jgi:hypothetical protein
MRMVCCSARALADSRGRRSLTRVPRVRRVGSRTRGGVFGRVRSRTRAGGALRAGDRLGCWLRSRTRAGARGRFGRLGVLLRFADSRRGQRAGGGGGLRLGLAQRKARFAGGRGNSWRSLERGA